MHRPVSVRAKWRALFIGSVSLCVLVMTLIDWNPGKRFWHSATTAASLQAIVQAESLQSRTDIPAPNGPPPIILQVKSAKYRAVHDVSRWDPVAHHWIAISPDLTEVNLVGTEGFGIDGITAALTRGGVWYVGTLVGGVIVKPEGQTWASRDRGLPRRTVQALAISPADPSGVTAAIGFGGFAAATPGKSGHVYLTQDAGVHWTDITKNLPDTPVKALRYIETEGKAVLAAEVGDHWYIWTPPNGWS